MPTQHLTWREAAPGIWQRDIDEIEKSYTALIRQYAGSGRMEFAITGHVTVSVSVENDSPADTASRLEDALRVAWLWLRNDNPTIASLVYFDKQLGKPQKRYETIRDEASRSAWLEKTFKTISCGQTGAEWANSDPPAPEEATLFMVEPPATHPSDIQRDLILRSPHAIIDGIGTLNLFNNLLIHFSRLFSSPSPAALPTLSGAETALLSPPYRIAAKIPSPPTLSQQALLAALQQPPHPNTASLPSLTLPYNPGPMLPGKHQRTALTLTLSQTSRLLTALKSHPGPPTVTHAFHAAIALLLRNISTTLPNPPTSTSPLVRLPAYILRNERPYLPSPYNTPSHAVAAYHSLARGKQEITLSSTPSPDSHQEFEQVMEQIRNYYLSAFSHSLEDHPTLAAYVFSTFTPDVPLDEGVMVPVPPPNEKPGVSLSSMGVVDRIIEPVRGVVEAGDPWVVGEELGSGLGCFLGTWRGRLTLSAAWNESWHGKEEVEGFLERCVGVVMGWVDDL